MAVPESYNSGLSRDKFLQRDSYSQQAPFALSNLLLLLRLQRNRRTRHNFAGLGIEDLHYLSMILIVERPPLLPPAQLFHPLSHFNPPRFTSIAMFTVRTVDSAGTTGS